MGESPDQRDYEWHFKLSSEDGDRLHADALTEMARQQLKALLGCMVLTADGVSLRVTGFRFLADPDAEHAIYADERKHAEAAETPPPDRGNEGPAGSGPQYG
jgi:hypothetical protein